MISRIYVNDYIFADGGDMTVCFKRFVDDGLAKHGYTFDLENQDAYKDFNIPIILNVGDAVELDAVPMPVITHKVYDIDNNIMKYWVEPA